MGRQLSPVRPKEGVYEALSCARTCSDHVRSVEFNPRLPQGATQEIALVPVVAFPAVSGRDPIEAGS
jgi:hypothetical protein